MQEGLSIYCNSKENEIAFTKISPVAFLFLPPRSSEFLLNSLPTTTTHGQRLYTHLDSEEKSERGHVKNSKKNAHLMANSSVLVTMAT